jgi:type IV secretory pathway VirJ component
MSHFYLLFLLVLIPFTGYYPGNASRPSSLQQNIYPVEELTVKPNHDDSEGDLPIKVFGTEKVTDLPMLVFITGDGGWNKFSSALCSDINQKGISVVVLDAQKYFWESKSPEETAIDLVSVTEKYLKEWKKERFVIAGFSFGADIVPFLINRFPAGIKERVVSSILISPDKTCDFEIHLTDMLNMGISKGKYDVIKEIQKSDFKNFTVVFGSDESENSKHPFQLSVIKLKILQGNHHFDSEYEAVANLIVDEMKNSVIR